MISKADSVILLIFFFLSVHCYCAQNLYKEKLASGLYYFHFVLNNPDGPVSVHMLSSKISHSDRIFRVELCGEKLSGKGLVSETCRKSGALAGVNGSYFGGEVGPLGIIMIEKELISVPIMSRSAFGITPDEKFIWGNPHFDGAVEFREAEARAVIYGINQYQRENQLIIYSQEFGKNTPETPVRREYAVLRNRIISISNGNSLIPPGGYVISVSGNLIPSLARVGLMDSVRQLRGLNENWSSARFAVGGGPRLIENGKICSSFRNEGFQKDVIEGKAPRTALGTDHSGNLILAVIDGRNAEVSVGATLSELALIMQSVGCTEALNLDGGGSSVMVIRDRIVNRPSDGKERLVNNALLLF